MAAIQESGFEYIHKHPPYSYAPSDYCLNPKMMKELIPF